MKINSTPFFSIIIPTYNRENSIQRVSYSVLNQEFQSFELLIIDDGSSDNTKKVIQQIQSEKLNYYYQDNAGVCAARNNGVRNAKGKYLVFLDSDDDVLNDWLVNYYNIIRLKDADLVFCDLKIIKNDGTEDICKARMPYKKKGKGIGVYMAGAFCLKRTLFEKIGGYNEELKFGENTELSIRLGQENPRCAFTDSVSLLYYQSVDGGSKNIDNQIASNIYILKKHANYFRQHGRLKWIYTQYIGVSSIRLKNFKQGRYYLWEALKVRPYRLDTLLRFVISLSPLIAKKVWNR